MGRWTDIDPATGLSRDDVGRIESAVEQAVGFFEGLAWERGPGAALRAATEEVGAPLAGIVSDRLLDSGWFRDVETGTQWHHPDELGRAA